ncbi:MAG: MazF family transcriptional regulator [Gammaproteobacteria bacterium RIFCSPHIGHO2_02_FULL_39_13]|nr:MAG: MazF family transcriptional regulator [Gammaproteobacteria bacterium RIFCSPHIGHO2_02_FULL_39_13]OGT48321.1 MAG: MazF family transcriptional regulator [Gammaproteobacteria bacterium RIFCSPHIGHO2_12_FULL_39_24]
MGKILKGDIVWANLNPSIGHEQSGLRPVLVLSHDFFNEKSKTVIVVPLTSRTQKIGFPLTLQLNQKIMKKQAWIKISQIRNISVLRIGKKIDHLDSSETKQVIDGLNEILS